jgi:hypothetical protein
MGMTVVCLTGSGIPSIKTLNFEDISLRPRYNLGRSLVF